MDIDKDPFEWLRRECALIKSKRFHIFDKISSDEIDYSKGNDTFELTGTYPCFLKEFGWARLFTDHNDAPVISVYPLKDYRRYLCEDGSVYIGFGYRAGTSVFFDEAEICSSGTSRVYVVSKKRAKLLAPDFSEWLHSAYDWVKGKHSHKKWEGIVAGPPPFSDEEERIAQARELVSWRFVGYADDGDALFEVSNMSDIVLPFLTIGVTDSQRKILTGGAWLDIGGIPPGCTAVVKNDCYKDRIPRGQLEVFDLPRPIPEKKMAYWEFGQ